MSNDKDLIVAGIGASAGGVEALEQLFRSLGREPRMAFVVTIHHAHGQESTLTEILGRCASFPVRMVTDGARPEVDNAYVCPPDSVVTLTDGRLRLQSWPVRGTVKPIDDFFASLAQDRGELAIGVILSGAGSDGTLGAKAIKEEGGLTIAQGTNGAGPRHSGMIDSAIAAGVVDLVLPMHQIAARLASFAKSVSEKRDVVARPPENAFDAIHRVLRSQIGHDFSGYKQKTFGRRVFRRMQILEMPSLDAYLAHLQQSPLEAKSLFRELLIGVTSFFRDPVAFEALEQSVISKILNDKGPSDLIRVWVPGCSTGEEVYSIAILFREQMDNVRTALKLQIFATDIDEDALSVARSGRFPAALMDGVPQERLKRFFINDDISYTISKDIRDLCIFSTRELRQHDAG